MKKIIGITGGISSGKSTVTKYLINKGYYVIDADKISKMITEPGNLGNKLISIHFGASYFNGDILDRKKLGDLIFHNPKKRKELDEILHPIIKKEIISEIEERDEDIIFLDIPLLFEAHFDDLCDSIILVYINKDIQIKRLMERDNISYDMAILKIDSQMSLEEKKKKSDYIINNNSDLINLYKEIDNILERI